MKAEAALRLTRPSAISVLFGTMAGAGASWLESAGSGWWFWATLTGALAGMVVSGFAALVASAALRFMGSIRRRLAAGAGAGIVLGVAFAGTLVVSITVHGLVFSWFTSSVISLAAALAFLITACEASGESSRSSQGQ